MLPTQSGSLRIFRLAGVDVYVHWTWLLVAVFEIQARQGREGGYERPLWNVLEYLTLFGIVLLHEFGHAMACRQVGGTANQIMLWPLGGVAYVNPPPRPGAVLWSIAAGPLVNLALVPLTVGAFLAGMAAGLAETAPDLQKYLLSISVINAALLVFNLLPIYPLDGGQILQSLLWFFIGRAKSLAVASAVGLVAGASAVLLAVVLRDVWIGVLAGFVVLRCWNGWQTSQLMLRMLRAPRRAGFACPSCGAPPIIGPHWGCAKCRALLDLFEHGAACPYCRTPFSNVECPECRQRASPEMWVRGGRRL